MFLIMVISSIQRSNLEPMMRHVHAMEYVLGGL